MAILAVRQREHPGDENRLRYQSQNFLFRARTRELLVSSHFSFDNGSQERCLEKGIELCLRVGGYVSFRHAERRNRYLIGDPSLLTIDVTTRRTARV